MFQSARLQLTAWYLLIIMLISMFFSFVIYDVTTQELVRVINRIEFRREHPSAIIPDRFPPPPGIDSTKTLEELENTKNRILYNLLFINGIIFFIAGGSAYFLAGRTLRPIQLMIDEQNQFITNSSHEFRTPLATMRAEMEANLLEKHLTDKRARELINSNLEELSSLQVLTNKLLDLAKIHPLNPSHQKEDFMLSEIVLAAQRKVYTLAKKKQITIDLHLQDSISLKGDKQQLTEVIIILLDNAIKYSFKQTTIIITTETKRNAAIIRVTDTGKGIALADIPHIFERFYRADASRSEIEGHGLGLSIAKKIIETHNGTISVISKESEGTTFTVELPVEQKP